MKRALCLLLAFVATMAMKGQSAEPVYGIPPGECESTIISTAFSAMPADWSVEYMKLSDVHKRATGKGVRAVVLDTGCDLDHRDFAGDKIESKDYTNSRTGPSDVNGHGTHCRGILKRCAPGAEIGNYKVLGDNGSGSSSGIARAIRDAADAGFKVLSLSLGGGAPDSATESAVKYAEGRGCLVICAAGNSGPREGTVGWPAAFPESIAIASIAPGGAVANYSSRGKEVWIAAPGSSIVSTYPGNRYATLSGTSMACPFVAGAACVWIESETRAGRSPTPARFREALAKHAKDIPPPGRDTASGHGLNWLLAMIEDGGTNPPPSPSADVVVSLDDLSPAARSRVLAADPKFESITIKRSK